MPSRILELSAVIASNTEKVDEYFRLNNLSCPSFDPTSPMEQDLPEDIVAARMLILDATTELHDLMLTPKQILHNQAHNNIVSLHAISRFDLATRFPVDQTVSYLELSASSGLNVIDLRRIIRHAATLRVFKEVDGDFVTHTAASRLLAGSEQMRDWLAVACDDLWPAAMKTVDAMVKWPGSQEPNETGFALAHNTSNSLYAELGQQPSRAKRFAEGLSTYTSGDEFSVRHIVSSLGWNTNDSLTFVDIGGSRGDTSIALARKFPNVRCVVQDLPEVVASCSKSDPANNVEFMAHDFFTEQPVKDADVYFLRWILHNWSDNYCIRILRQLIPALKEGSRILINEFVLPKPGEVPLEIERAIRLMDLCMLEILNSRERDLNDWMHLFESADSRFRFKGITLPRGSALHLIEVVWELN